MNKLFIDAVDDISRCPIKRFNFNFNKGFSSYIIDSYYTNDDKFKRFSISQKDVVEDRKKMIEILSDFYKTTENKENFVTLFSIYCNYYIKYNIHQVLSDEDFGISELFDVIEDKDLQEYLKLIQQGIYKQDISYFEKAIEKKDKYSLPYLYLFIFSVKKYSISKLEEYNKLEIVDFAKDELYSVIKGCKRYVKCNEPNVIYFERLFDNKNDTISEIIDYLDKINSDDLKNYLLGKSNIFKNSEFPLPYLKVFNDEDDFLEFVIEKSIDYNKKYGQDILYRTDDNNTDLNDKKNIINFFIKKIKKSVNCNKNKFDNKERGEDFYNKIRDVVEDIVNNKDDVLSHVKFSNIEYLRDSDCINDREYYLGIPSIVFPYNFLSIILNQSHLYKEKEKIKREQDDIIRDFTDKYRNIKATTLKDIAMRLLESDDKDYIRHGKVILKEYSEKETLTKGIKILLIKYEKNPDKLHKLLRGSLAEGNDSSKNGIDKVINQSLFYCFINSFYNDDAKFNLIRNNLKKNLVIGKLFEYRKTFEQNVISKTENCINWLSNNGIHIKIDYDDWKLIFFKEYDYAFIYFQFIFEYLFLNFFSYGDLKQISNLKLFSEADYLIIVFENYFLNNRGKQNDNIKKIYELVSILSVNCKEPLYKNYEDRFKLEIKLPKKVFLLDN